MAQQGEHNSRLQPEITSVQQISGSGQGICMMSMAFSRVLIGLVSLGFALYSGKAGELACLNTRTDVS